MIDNSPAYIVKFDADMIAEAIAMLEKVKEKHPDAKIYIEIDVMK